MDVLTIESTVEVLPVMGQDQDLFGGGFEADQSFSGKMADLRMTSRVMTPEQIQQFFSCNFEEGWFLFDEWQISDIERTNEASDYFCEEDKLGKYFISLKELSFNESKEVCNMVQGKLILPDTVEELAKKSDIFFDILETNNLSVLYPGFWMGHNYITEENKWIDTYTKETVPENHFVYMFKRPNKGCMVKYKPKNDFYSISCLGRTASTFCKIENNAKYHLKGLCSDSIQLEFLFDDVFHIYGMKNKSPHFQ